MNFQNFSDAVRYFRQLDTFGSHTKLEKVQRLKHQRVFPMYRMSFRNAMVSLDCSKL